MVRRSSEIICNPPRHDLQSPWSFAIDPAQKNCNVRSHPSDKNKDVARVGHPDSVVSHIWRDETAPDMGHPA
jgi:hypothetical protein